MSKGKQSQFYKTKAWQDCRDAYMRSVGGLCERCLAKGLIVPAEIVHHKKHLNEKNINDPSVALNFDNLIAVCRQCHGDEHRKIVKRYQIAEDGSIISK